MKELGNCPKGPFIAYGGEKIYLIPFNFRLPLIYAPLNFRPLNFLPPLSQNSQIRSLFISLPLNFKGLKSDRSFSIGGAEEGVPCEPVRERRYI